MQIVFDTRTANDYFPGIGRYVINLLKAISEIETELSFLLLGDQKEFVKLPNLHQISHIQCNISPFSILILSHFIVISLRIKIFMKLKKHVFSS